VVYAGKGFGQYAQPVPEISPEWSPVKYYGGYQNK
jgi:hypothetical protein